MPDPIMKADDIHFTRRSVLASPAEDLHQRGDELWIGTWTAFYKMRVSGRQLEFSGQPFEESVQREIRRRLWVQLFAGLEDKVKQLHSLVCRHAISEPTRERIHNDFKEIEELIRRP